MLELDNEEEEPAAPDFTAAGVPLAPPWPRRVIACLRVLPSEAAERPPQTKAQGARRAAHSADWSTALHMLLVACLIFGPEEQAR
jgi:hypothetical protein